MSREWNIYQWRETQLILRLCRLFDLQEAQSALHVIGVSGRTDDVVPSTSTAEGPIVETRDGIMHGSNGRNHFQFPPEEPTVSFAPTTPEERAAHMAILSTKAMTCLGDIARYRELYNESGGSLKQAMEIVVRPEERGTAVAGLLLKLSPV